MQENIALEQLVQAPSADFSALGSPADAPPAGSAPAAALDDLRRLSEVPVEVTVEIGRTRMTVGETLGLHPGAIVILERTSGEPVDLLVNGTLIARGEVVVVDEQFGLRVTHVIGYEPAPEDPADGE